MLRCLKTSAPCSKSLVQNVLSQTETDRVLVKRPDFMKDKTFPWGQKQSKHFTSMALSVTSQAADEQSRISAATDPLSKV